MMELELIPKSIYILCRAFFHVAGTGLFWLCMLGSVVAGLLPRFVVKILIEYYRPSDIQIAREAEKFGTLREFESAEVEMNSVSDPARG